MDFIKKKNRATDIDSDVKIWKSFVHSFLRIIGDTVDDAYEDHGFKGQTDIRDTILGPKVALKRHVHCIMICLMLGYRRCSFPVFTKHVKYNCNWTKLVRRLGLLYKCHWKRHKRSVEPRASYFPKKAAILSSCWGRIHSSNQSLLDRTCVPFVCTWLSPSLKTHNARLIQDTGTYVTLLLYATRKRPLIPVDPMATFLWRQSRKSAPTSRTNALKTPGYRSETSTWWDKDFLPTLLLDLFSLDYKLFRCVLSACFQAPTAEQGTNVMKSAIS